MNPEHELKFLLPPNSVNVSLAEQAISIDQIYFLQGEISQRLRRTSKNQKNPTYEITFKFRKGDHSDEYLIPVSPQVGADLYQAACQRGIQEISKTRYLFGRGDSLKWEVDVFNGEHDFLVLAELEYDGKSIPKNLSQKPNWFIGKEWNYEKMNVTGDWEFLDQIWGFAPKSQKAFRDEVLKRLETITNAT
ncbi:hypothetical protein ACFL2B_02615 [Patescibacteria group bacterium]